VLRLFSAAEALPALPGGVDPGPVSAFWRSPTALWAVDRHGNVFRRAAGGFVFVYSAGDYLILTDIGGSSDRDIWIVARQSFEARPVPYAARFDGTAFTTVAMPAGWNQLPALPSAVAVVDPTHAWMSACYPETCNEGRIGVWDGVKWTDRTPSAKPH